MSLLTESTFSKLKLQVPEMQIWCQKADLTQIRSKLCLCSKCFTPCNQILTVQPIGASCSRANFISWFCNEIDKFSNHCREQECNSGICWEITYASHFKWFYKTWNRQGPIPLNIYKLKEKGKSALEPWVGIREILGSTSSVTAQKRGKKRKLKTGAVY